MTGYRVERPPARPAIHPGDVLRGDMLPAPGLSTGAAEKRLEVSRRRLRRAEWKLKDELEKTTLAEAAPAA